MIVCLEAGVAKCKFSAGVEKAITDKREEDRSRHLTVQAFFSCGLLQEYVTHDEEARGNRGDARSNVPLLLPGMSLFLPPGPSLRVKTTRT